MAFAVGRPVLVVLMATAVLVLVATFSFSIGSGSDGGQRAAKLLAGLSDQLSDQILGPWPVAAGRNGTRIPRKRSRRMGPAPAPVVVEESDDADEPDEPEAPATLSAATIAGFGKLGQLDLREHYEARWLKTKDVFADEAICEFGKKMPDDQLTLHVRLSPGSAVAAGRPRVAIVMSDHRPMPDWRTVDVLKLQLKDFLGAEDDKSREEQMEKAKYHIYCFFLNLFYAVRHGYDFLYVSIPGSPQLPDLRFPAWGKVMAIKALAPNYEYLLYLDSDSYVRRQRRTVESIAGRYGVGPGSGAPTGKVAADAPPMAPSIGGNRLMVSSDLPNAPHVANTGNMVIYQPDSAAKKLVSEFLVDLWTRPMKDESLKMNLGWWAWEQASFHVIYPDWKEKLGIAIAPMEYMTSPEGDTIRHLWSALKFRERTRMLQDAVVIAFLDFVADLLKTGKR